MAAGCEDQHAEGGQGRHDGQPDQPAAGIDPQPPAPAPPAAAPGPRASQEHRREGGHSRGTSTQRISSPQQLVDRAAFHLRLGREDDAMPQGGQGQLDDVVGHGVVAPVEGGQRAAALHQGQPRAGRRPHVELRPLPRQPHQRVDVVQAASDRPARCCSAGRSPRSPADGSPSAARPAAGPDRPARCASPGCGLPPRSDG